MVQKSHNLNTRSENTSTYLLQNHDKYAQKMYTSPVNFYEY